MISIILPVYNREEYIEECIQSVFSQSYQNFEIIVIDDGSTDRTLMLCRKIAEKDSRVIILESPHLGVSAARNLGLDAAKGDFVFFIDSDDIIHPQLLEVLVASLKGTDADISGTKRIQVLDKNWDKVYPYIEKDNGPGEVCFLSFEEALEDVFNGNSPFGVIGGVMMRRSIIDSTRFRTDLFIGEDYFFVYENLIKGVSAVSLKQSWYFARLHKTNTSWDFGYSGFMNRLLRRELVWKSEEAAGRIQYANQQKNAAFLLYPSFVKNKTLSYHERQKARRALRNYGKYLFSGLTVRNRILYILFLWVPGGYAAYNFVKTVLRKEKHNKK